MLSRESFSCLSKAVPERWHTEQPFTVDCLRNGSKPLNIQDKGALLLLLCLSQGLLASARGTSRHPEDIPYASSPLLLLEIGPGQNPVASAPNPADIFREGK